MGELEGQGATECCASTKQLVQKLARATIVNCNTAGQWQRGKGGSGPTVYLLLEKKDLRSPDYHIRRGLPFMVSQVKMWLAGFKVILWLQCGGAILNEIAPGCTCGKHCVSQDRSSWPG